MRNRKYIMIVLCAGFLLSACYKYKGNDGYLSDLVEYPSINLTANLGETFVSDPMQVDGSTRPLEFSIAGIYDADRNPVALLSKEVDTKIWALPYTGTEETLAEMQAKTIAVKRRVLDIDTLSGSLVVYPEAAGLNIPTGKTFYVDVAVTNGGGQRIVKNAAALTFTDNKESFISQAYLNEGDADFKLEAKFKRLGDGNKLIVRYVNSKDEPYDPAIFQPVPPTQYEPFPSLYKLPGGNPLKKEQLNDRVEMDVYYPIPASGNKRDVYRITSIMAGEIDGKYLEIGMRWGIYVGGTWEIKYIIDKK
ncbi:DUF5007 domain-containing protein [Chitinophaga defluvii]|uniref:DUF5007 domain-containing protein n=1 Tax=Chitinophaga defluvii TaxID=3163343 RepID=A0ABV2TB48_9BACT